MDLNEIAQKSDNAIFSGNTEEIKNIIEILEPQLNDNRSDEKNGYIRYILANLYSRLSGILHEHASNWRSNQYPINLTYEINQLRLGAVACPPNIKEQLETNLAIALTQQRRTYEALDLWHTDYSIKGDAPFVSSRAKAKELLWISYWLNDPSHSQLYQYEAYKLLKALKEKIPETDHPQIIECFENDNEIIRLLEEGEKKFKDLADWDKEYDGDSYESDEKKYRLWCLEHKLFANPINDLTKNWIADKDILQFPDHTTGIELIPYFSAAFSSIKREFCFARFLAYESEYALHPSYEEKQLFLTNTLDFVDYSGSIEKTKTSLRICFSIFDSISFLMNAYFSCNSKHTAFSPRWIKENFKDKETNYFIDSLYWLSCDLTDNPDLTINPEKWKAPNPNSAEIRRIRNSIEHGWLRVSEGAITKEETNSDFAYIVPPHDLRAHTFTVLKLARAAMFYLCMAVSYNEKEVKKRDPSKLIVGSQVIIMEDEFISFRG